MPDYSQDADCQGGAGARCRKIIGDQAANGIQRVESRTVLIDATNDDLCVQGRHFSLIQETG